jgi:hypothetical protein
MEKTKNGPDLELRRQNGADLDRADIGRRRLRMQQT